MSDVNTDSESLIDFNHYRTYTSAPSRFNRVILLIAVSSLVLIFLMLLMINIILIITIIKTSNYISDAPNDIKSFLDTYALRVLLSI